MLPDAHRGRKALQLTGHRPGLACDLLERTPQHEQYAEESQLAGVQLIEATLFIVEGDCAEKAVATVV